MTVPRPYEPLDPIEPRLVTKTSLPKPKAAIALLLILWFENDKPGEFTYGCASGVTSEGGIFSDGLVEDIHNYAARHNIDLDRDEIKTCLKGNPLLESQMESLSSACELVWRLGSLSFVDGALSKTAERKDGLRYQKTIRFSSNLDLVGILEETNPDAFAHVLMSWLTSGQIATEVDVEDGLVRMLAVFSEPALYKSSKGERGTVFDIRGIYDTLLGDRGDLGVDVVDEGEEPQGTTRILKAAMNEKLFPALAIHKNTVAIADGVDKEGLEAYASRVRVSAQIANVKLEGGVQEASGSRLAVARTDETHSLFPKVQVNEPRNLIFFGAPGTGKSYQLNQLANSFGKENVSRVTFYPDYTYSQFVGSLKPVTRYQYVPNDKKSVKEHNSELTNGESCAPQTETGERMEAYISYEFVPGPFLDVYIKAVQNPDDYYLLVVEEINRANPAAVFGDVFQLLDRDSNGRSVYEVAVPRDMRSYFETFLPEYATTAHISDPEELLSEHDRLTREMARLSLPPNMYIWATMNSADQGVFPMDTAFKRRWDFRYMGINEGEDAVIDGTPLNKIVVPCGGRNVVWNDLRRAINDFMASDSLKINEDKLLGPFFIAPAALTPKRFDNTFKDKVLLYLYEDAGKTKRLKMFKKGLNTYSKVCEAFDEMGEGIFGEGFDGSALVDVAADADDSPAEE